MGPWLTMGTPQGISMMGRWGEMLVLSLRGPRVAEPQEKRRLREGEWQQGRGQLTLQW